MGETLDSTDLLAENQKHGTSSYSLYIGFCSRYCNNNNTTAGIEHVILSGKTGGLQCCDRCIRAVRWRGPGLTTMVDYL